MTFMPMTRTPAPDALLLREYTHVSGYGYYLICDKSDKRKNPSKDNRELFGTHRSV